MRMLNHPGINWLILQDLPLRSRHHQTRTIAQALHPFMFSDMKTPLALRHHDHFLLAQPIMYENLFWTTADYRYGFFRKEHGTLHRGLDLPAIEGTPVLASGDGEVVFSGWGILYGLGAKNDPYGITVKIKHTLKHEGKTIYTVYSHLGQTLVKLGIGYKPDKKSAPLA